MSKDITQPPGVTLLMRQSRRELVFLASLRDLDTDGKKIDIAKRIYDYQDAKANELWRKIVG